MAALRRRTLIAAGLALAMAGKAQAAPVSFTPAERKVIARNPALKDLVRKDPAAVRAALDAIAAAKQPGAPAGSPGGRAMPDRAHQDLLRRNPDLVPVEGASPEAINDLLQRIKAAGSGTSSQTR